MSIGQLLKLEPPRLEFPLELDKQISCSLHLSNESDNHIAFKVKTTNPKGCFVKPNMGILLPRSTCEILVTKQALKEFPDDMQCNDKFIIQYTVVATPGATMIGITGDMFSKKAGLAVEEYEMRAVYVSATQSQVVERPEQSSSPEASGIEDGNLEGSEKDENNMSTEELLKIEPLQLKFRLELKKRISCALCLSNKTEKHIAFKVFATNPKDYTVKPNMGIILPQSACEIIVTKQALKKGPDDMHCKDKFLIKSIVASPSVTVTDITSDMFNGKTGVVEKFKLGVVYISPIQEKMPDRSEQSSSFGTSAIEDETSVNKYEESGTSTNADEDNGTSINKHEESSKIIDWLLYIRDHVLMRRHQLPVDELKQCLLEKCEK